MDDNKEQWRFFGFTHRTSNILRWPGKHQKHGQECLKRHSFDTANICYALAIISREVFGNQHIDPDSVAVAGLCHDLPESAQMLDVSSPLKHVSPELKAAFKTLELEAHNRLMKQMPEWMSKYYRARIDADLMDSDTRRLVKGADRIAAYLKAKLEVQNGNGEFRDAYQDIKTHIDKHIEQGDSPEVKYFLDHFSHYIVEPVDQLFRLSDQYTEGM
tara:strand:+ start:1469 stop:2116 length:648 start_codon:yes stop_codon:yes gene_type:complete